jgi:hypothetical protein
MLLKYYYRKDLQNKKATTKINFAVALDTILKKTVQLCKLRLQTKFCKL